jgi:hypothetical protein
MKSTACMGGKEVRKEGRKERRALFFFLFFGFFFPEEGSCIPLIKGIRMEGGRGRGVVWGPAFAFACVCVCVCVCAWLMWLVDAFV